MVVMIMIWSDRTDMFYSSNEMEVPWRFGKGLFKGSSLPYYKNEATPLLMPITQNSL